MNDFSDAPGRPSDDAAVRPWGRVRPAPENTLPSEALDRARRARRSFMGRALAMGAGAGAGAAAHAPAPGAGKAG
ncbi:MAG: hypothetical protein M9885_01865, partial [Burkholderiaceae bacterium]|nr:hypothetical protein [Burkholderiaceae bacterium]